MKLLYCPFRIEHPSVLIKKKQKKQVRPSHSHVKHPHTLYPVSLLGSEGARCPFNHPVLPICQSPFSPPRAPSTPLTAPPRTSCPFSPTLATCHWKESITLSAH